MRQSWLILGASSAMARGFARRVSEQGADVFLAGRDMDDLTRMAADCHLRGAPVAEALKFDARKPAGFAAINERLAQQDGTLILSARCRSRPRLTPTPP